MNNYYQNDFPAWMTPDHPAAFPTVTYTLAAYPAEGFLISGTFNYRKFYKALKTSFIWSLLKDISIPNYSTNQKKGGKRQFYEPKTLQNSPVQDDSNNLGKF